MADQHDPTQHPQQPAATSPRDKRIVKHIRALGESGQDIEKFVGALKALRDDAGLTTPQREAIFKTLAQDAAQAYFVMVTGMPIDLDQLAEQIGEEVAVLPADKAQPKAR
jgi:hypothetical protein